MEDADKMTLAAVWVRQNSTLRELVAIADSRISGGESWDKCPKLMPLPRPATAIVMSGDATEAYAFLIQATNTCLLLDGNHSGQTDIGYLARKLRDVYSDSRSEIGDLDSSGIPSIPTLDVVLIGWSWRRLRFEGYSYRYDKHGVLRMKRLDRLDPGIAYGVYFAADAALEAKRRLRNLKRTRNHPVPMTGDPMAREKALGMNLDWEPLEILLELIADPAERTVGGVPQLLKIYQNGATECFVWRTESGVDHFGGRPVTSRERFDRRIASFVDGRLEIAWSDRSVSSAASLEDGLAGD